MIGMLESLIEKLPITDVPKEKIEDLEKKLKEAHDEKLTTIDGQHVFSLWGNGEILMTKGGDCYGQRNVITYARPLLKLPKITFPASNEDGGYAILSMSTARELRAIMETMDIQ